MKKTYRLYELPERQNIKLYFLNHILIFDHIDGLYSYCWFEKNKKEVIHLGIMTLFKKYKDGYKYIGE